MYLHLNLELLRTISKSPAADHRDMEASKIFDDLQEGLDGNGELLTGAAHGVSVDLTEMMGDIRTVRATPPP